MSVLSPTFNRGLGQLSVKSPIRLPRPAAKIIAFIGLLSSNSFTVKFLFLMYDLIAQTLVHSVVIRYILLVLQKHNP